MSCLSCWIQKIQNVFLWPHNVWCKLFHSIKITYSVSLSHCVQVQHFVCFPKQMMQFLRARKSRLLGRGWHCMSQGRAVSSMTPVLFVLATHITLLQSPFTDSACCSSLPHSHFIHTDTCKLQILPFLMAETMLRYMFLYIDIHLAIYNWIRAEEVQSWKSGLRQESGLPV